MDHLLSKEYFFHCFVSVRTVVFSLTLKTTWVNSYVLSNQNMLQIKSKDLVFGFQTYRNTPKCLDISCRYVVVKGKFSN